ncbi:ras-domain-containing protein [Polyplosphaeria fusca]|uniref:Ras-domain-containing protein n=1 Tax=Polyplosphaeria fusca TaxID=682080 RepID=A0A9P4QMX2_9PLEO|nr:ras-domain-containing protein [Polyplosphaeria fusca]
MEPTSLSASMQKTPHSARTPTAPHQESLKAAAESPGVSLKCVVTGDSCCDKYQFVRAATNGISSPEYVPTVYENYNIDMDWRGKRVRLGIWDTTGQEDYDRLRPLSYLQADVVFVLFSIIDRTSFDNVRLKWIPEIHHFAPGVHKILVGVKKGLRGDAQVLEELGSRKMSPVMPHEGFDLAKAIKAFSYIECDADSMENVSKPFDEVGATVFDDVYGVLKFV